MADAVAFVGIGGEMDSVVIVVGIISIGRDGAYLTGAIGEEEVVWRVVVVMSWR